MLPLPGTHVSSIERIDKYDTYYYARHGREKHLPAWRVSFDDADNSVLYVVRKEAAAVSAGEITAHAAAQLARFKVPREVIFVDTLPRNALGKVQHFLLRQQARGE